MNEEQWRFVDRVHGLIPMGEQGPCNFLTLVCTGHTTGWAASFDFNLDPEWYEHTERYPFAARADTPAEAIYRAAMLVHTIVLR